jgi:hypothetical protein
VIVEAAGFAPFRRRLEPGGEAGPLTIVLRRSFADRVTVTASRVPERLGETPSSVVVLGSEALETTPALAVDDALRQVPGFTLFRRAGSRTANPTTQGASLRGVGGSGASRALVLDDGVPLNDPFGGWVYWSRVPRVSLERVEVLRGGASDLYGSSALAGVVHLVRRRPEETRLDLDVSFGSQSTPDGAMAGSLRKGDWGFRLAATSFDTDGYVAVAPEERGTVDTPLTSRHDGIEVGVERAPDSGSRLFLSASAFRESRGNGTPLQVNDTRLRQAVIGFDRTAADTITARAYVGDGFTTRSLLTRGRPDGERLNRPAQPASVAGRGASGAGAGRGNVLVAGRTCAMSGHAREVAVAAVAGPLVGNEAGSRHGPVRRGPVSGAASRPPPRSATTAGRSPGSAAARARPRRRCRITSRTPSARDCLCATRRRRGCRSLPRLTAPSGRRRSTSCTAPSAWATCSPSPTTPWARSGWAASRPGDWPASPTAGSRCAPAASGARSTTPSPT